MSRLRTSVAVAVLAAVTLLVTTPALAHEQRTVGVYRLRVGWLIEPAYTGAPNAVELFVRDATGSPLDALGSTGVKVQVAQSGRTSDQRALNPGFDPDTGLGLHGQFLASIVPTRPGTYVFHITGDINGQRIDQQFTSGPKTFNDVVDPSAVQFPDKVPTNGALADAAKKLSPRLDTALSAANAGLGKAKSAKDSAGAAMVVAIVALVAGLGLGGAGLIIGLAGRRRPTSPATPAPAGPATPSSTPSSTPSGTSP